MESALRWGVAVANGNDAKAEALHDKGGSDALVDFGPKRTFKRCDVLRCYAGGRSHRDFWAAETRGARS
jgi:hypothetical protein